MLCAASYGPTMAFATAGERMNEYRPRCSALYLPASNLRAIEKARGLACDVVILDLEDAVAPEAKDVARSQALDAVRAGGFAGELVVRVNGLDTPWGTRDLAALAAVPPAAVLVPKIDDAADIVRYDRALAHAPEAMRMWAMIETARSLFRLGEIAAASETSRLSLLVMGTNDLAKDMGAMLTPARTPFLGALGLAIAAARGWGIGILDGVYNDLEDDAGFTAQCRQAVEFGFDGKTLIHPRQVAPCNIAFSPSPEALAEARAIVDAFDQPENAGKGAIRIDGRMVERLHLIQAQRRLAIAAQSAQ